MKTLKRSKCAVLPLVLKGKWYRMIESGEKREEYRDDTEYWTRRMESWIRRTIPGGRPLVVEFRLGYATNAPRMAFKAWSPRFRRGIGNWSHPEWGEKSDLHWVIKLGERVRLA